jgi:hypothetical protein
MRVDEEQCVEAGGCEAEGLNLTGEPLVPSSRCPFEPVERLGEEAYVVMVGVVDEASPLEAVDVLSQLIM